MAMANNAWMAAGHHAAPVEDEYGQQMRAMGLKIFYRFDKDSQTDCLAKVPQLLHIQTIPLETHTVGLVDLKICLRAIIQGSPELVSQQDTDYTVYSHDYSEPDVPLVGQGMLSWLLNSSDASTAGGQSENFVTGKVVKNILPGIKEILEVRFKLTGMAKFQRPERAPPTPTAMAPSTSSMSDNAEWNAFIQSNPAFGQPAPNMLGIASIPSPALAAPIPSRQPATLPPLDTRAEMSSSVANSMVPRSAAGSRQSSRAPLQRFPSQVLTPPGSQPSMSQHQQQQQQAAAGSLPPPPPHHQQSDDQRGSLPTPTEPRPASAAARRPSSRPSSRASTRAPTGRPRGRPRKKAPQNEGTTSGVEDATDVEDSVVGGPVGGGVLMTGVIPSGAAVDAANAGTAAAAAAGKKKRAKTTKAAWDKAPLGAASDSLRVAASTAGSLRNFRPLGAAPDLAGAGSHLQEVPRAPTPVPGGARGEPKGKARRGGSSLRRESTANSADLTSEAASSQHPYATARMMLQHESQFQAGQDARSPAESMAPSPGQLNNYTPEDSPAEIGSSPPVPRSAVFINSSPMPSSPILPPMLPHPHADSGFMSGGIEDLLHDEEFLKTCRLEDFLPDMAATDAMDAADAAELQAHLSMLPVAMQRDQVPESQALAKRKSQPEASTPTNNFISVLPGPRELLPTSSLYKVPMNNTRKIQAEQYHISGVQMPPLKRRKTQDASRKSSVSKERSPTGAHMMIPMTDDADARSQDDAMQLDRDPAEAGGANEVSTVPRKDGPPTDANTPAAAKTPGPADASDGLPLPPPPRPTSADAAAPLVLPKPPTPATPALVLPEPPVSAPQPGVGGPGAEGTSQQQQVSSAAAAASRNNKNTTRKESIKERLEAAILRGEIPPFCYNCGAIETPTWRKIWTQDHQGAPAYYEYSEKAGKVTAVEVLERDDDGRPTQHRLIKKTLGQDDDKREWTEVYLCNPCGIWFAKFKSHRPQDRWEKETTRPGGDRRRRGTGGPKARKSRARGEAQINPTSEAYFTTDPAGPADPLSSPPPDRTTEAGASQDQNQASSQTADANKSAHVSPAAEAAAPGGSRASRQSSSSSSASRRTAGGGGIARLASAAGAAAGAAAAATALGSAGKASPQTEMSQDDLGSTRRLLFPSPRKDGAPKALGELAVNLVVHPPQTSPVVGDRHHKVVELLLAAGKENSPAGAPLAMMDGVPPTANAHDNDEDMAELFGTPPKKHGRAAHAAATTTKTALLPERPSTPPPKTPGRSTRASAAAQQTPFKTPTRPASGAPGGGGNNALAAAGATTPSHRPITRSVSKSIRSVSFRSPAALTTAAAALQRTPTRTPRSSGARLAAGAVVGTGSSALMSARRRNATGVMIGGQQHDLSDAFADARDMHGHHFFDSPFTATLNQLLSEAHDFTAGSDAHGLVNLDLSGVVLSPLPGSDESDHHHHLHHHHNHHNHLRHSDADDLEHAHDRNPRRRHPLQRHDSVASHLAATGALDFEQFLASDGAAAGAGAGAGGGGTLPTMPSSPPMLRKRPAVGMAVAAAGRGEDGAEEEEDDDEDDDGRSKDLDVDDIMLVGSFSDELGDDAELWVDLDA